MRVLIAPHHFDNLLSPEVVAEALAKGWRSAKPADEVQVHPLSDGSVGFLNVLPGTQEILTILHGGREQPVTVKRVSLDENEWHTVYCYTQSFSNTVVTPSGLRINDSSAMGFLLGKLIAAGARRIVIGASATPWHDGGAGAIRTLAQTLKPDLEIPELRNDAGEVNPEIATLLPGLKERLAGVSVVVASAQEVPLRGLHGAGADLTENDGVSPAVAQEIEQLTTEFVSQVDRVAAELANSSLLSNVNKSLLSRRSYIGAGGGVAFILAALGAQVFPGAWVVSEETGLNNALTKAEIVVTGAGVIAGHELGDGVVADVAGRASDQAIPVIVVGGQIDASRRQMFKVGIHAAYPVIDTPSGRPQIIAKAVTDVDLINRGKRVAKTWSR